MTKAEQQKAWEARIADYQASGQSVKEWCAVNGVTPRQLRYWLKKFKELKNPAQPGEPIQWLPVKIKETSFTAPEKVLTIKVGPASIEVREGFNPGLLSEVVQVLVNLC